MSLAWFGLLSLSVSCSRCRCESCWVVGELFVARFRSTVSGPVGRRRGVGAVVIVGGFGGGVVVVGGAVVVVVAVGGVAASSVVRPAC